jgi:hypothetical protein
MEEHVWTVVNQGSLLGTQSPGFLLEAGFEATLCLGYTQTPGLRRKDDI